MNSPTELKPASRTLDLDALMEKIRAEVAERKRLAPPIIPPEPPIAAADLAARRWTAPELLALPATDFARATHLAFFGREPTPDEFVRLRDRLLLERVGRMRILREFRRSSEARTQRLPIRGLTSQFIWDRFYWSPPAKFVRLLGRGVRNLWLLRRHIREFIDRVEVLERKAVESTAAHRSFQAAQIHDRQNINRHLRRLQETIEEDKKYAACRLELAEQRFDEALNETKSRLGLAENRLVDHWRDIVEHKRGLENLAAALQSESDQVGQGGTARKVAGESAHLLDPLYVSFEDRYRGTRADIKERQQVYLAPVKATYTAAGQAPVVDIGCGRGEWLELLSEAGIAARGYDMNRTAVEECRQRGLQAELADGLDALAALPAGSCSVVTAFHIIEHLPFETLVRLLDEALRVLAPGGELIVETPNPANLLVAAERFYFDPTHRNPLPCELTQYLLRSRGFQDVEILPLHPVAGNSQKEYADPMLRLLQEKLYGPQDYGAIGRKSA